MRMRTMSAAAAACVAVAMAVGCSSEGMSTRESGRQSYGMAMYTASGPAAVTTGGVPSVTSASANGPIVVAVTAAPVTTPARVAVAQMGELTPPAAMTDELRKHPELFRRIVPVTGSFDSPTDQYAARRRSDGDYSGNAAVADPTGNDILVRMRSLAGQQGMDYLLVFGGQIDHGNQGSGLQLLDLTIVGAFIVPSHGITVDGRAAGSLIDVRTGQIVMNFAAQSKGSGASPSAFVANVEQGAVLRNKDELVQKLTADVIAQMTDEWKANAGR